MTIHAKLSASGSARWIYCPGSVAAEDGIPDSTSVHAKEGTCAHELAEISLIKQQSPFDWVGQPLIENNEHTVAQEMAEYIQSYIDYCNGMPGEKRYECTVDYSEWVPGGFGTADFISYDESTSTLYVTDLKYGQGVRVHAENNSQGMLYALGAYSEYEGIYDVESVVIAIVQPRLDHISEWEISISDLLKWAEWVADRARMALTEGAERSPGEKQCQWCKAKARCPALRDYTAAVVMSDFDDLTEPKELDDDQLRKALDAKKLIISWLDSVETLVKSRLEAGDSFPGFKLVEGRSLRQWGDAEAASEYLQDRLGNDAYERKLLSPSKAEKALGKAKAKELREFIIKPQGKPTLVSDKDPRAPITSSLDDFDDLS